MDPIIEAILEVTRPIGITEPVLQFMLISAILGLSMYVVLYTGMFSLANAGFMAIGAYTAALLTRDLDWTLWQAVFASMVISGIIAIPVGLPVLRLRDIYLAIATIGFGEVVRVFFLNADEIIVWFRNTFEGTDLNPRRYQVFGGGRGIRGISQLTEVDQLVIFLVIASFFIVRLQRSRLGRAMAAVREDERAAANMGINVVYVKNMAFIISAMLAGAGGAFFAHRILLVTPEMFGFDQAVDILAYAVLGGTTVWPGPIVGGMILTALPEVLRFVNEYRGVMNGFLLLVVIVYFPGGVINPAGWMAVYRNIRVRLRGRRTDPADDPGTTSSSEAGD